MSASQQAAAPPPAPPPKPALHTPTAAETTKGLGLLLLATFCFSSMSLFVNLVGSRMASTQQSFIRFTFQLLFSVASICVSRRGRLTERRTWLGKPENRRKLISRAVWGAFGMTSYFYALSHIALSDATALVFTNIPITGILAHKLLGEPYGRVDAITAAAAMGGVVLIAQPSFLFGSGDAGSIPLLAVAVCLFGAATSAMAYVTIRSIGPNEDPLVLVLYFSVWGFAVCPLGATLQDWSFPTDGGVWAMLCGMGISGYVGQVLLNRGVQLAPAGPGTVMRYGDLIFSIIFQATLLGNPPGPLKILGALLIMSCVLGVLAKNRAKARAAKAAAAAAAAAATVADVAEGSGSGEERLALADAAAVDASNSSGGWDTAPLDIKDAKDSSAYPGAPFDIPGWGREWEAPAPAPAAAPSASSKQPVKPASRPRGASAVSAPGTPGLPRRTPSFGPAKPRSDTACSGIPEVVV